MNQCPYCNADIAEGYVGEVELESHLKEIHEVSFQTMHDAENGGMKNMFHLEDQHGQI